MSDGGKGLSLNDRPSHNTQKELAKEAGVSTGKLAQAEILIKEAPEEIKQELRAGAKKIGEAYPPEIDFDQNSDQGRTLKKVAKISVHQKMKNIRQ